MCPEKGNKVAKRAVRHVLYALVSLTRGMVCSFGCFSRRRTSECDQRRVRKMVKGLEGKT